MTTMPMPATLDRIQADVTRTQPDHTRGVSHLMPFLLAIALQAAASVLAVLIAGPMH